MVYKKGPRFRVRPVPEICEDMDEARQQLGEEVRTLFFPAGNTIAMSTNGLTAICRHAVKRFPRLERITVYGSSHYIAMKELSELMDLRHAGLSRIHVGLESGDNEVLRRVKKGTTFEEQVRAGCMIREAGMELSEYVILGLGGKELSQTHAEATAEAVSRIEPDFLRLRTLVPKIDTLLLHQIRKGEFRLLNPHQVLEETKHLIEGIRCRTTLTSDHYTNYIRLEGRLPEDRQRLISEIENAMKWDTSRFRPFFIGAQ
jgi:radical SAM superfamily enzyme YgiQ (UPF0313 family)